MADIIKMEDIIEKTDSTSETAEVEPTVETIVPTEEETEQGSLKTELERVQKVSKYTEKEKAEHALKMNFKRASELGVDVNKLLGMDTRVEVEESDEDDRPLTVGMLKKINQENAAKTALQSADEIQNETERELVKYHLNNTIKSTGIPTEDLKLARALVNAVKNTKIIEETTVRKVEPKSHSNSSSVDAKQDKEVQLTPDEQQLMKVGGLTLQEVIDSRAGKKYSFDSLRAK